MPASELPVPPLTPSAGIGGEDPEDTSLALLFAHDVRSPVSAIALLAEVLHEQLGDEVDPAHRRRLDLLRGAAQAFDALVEDLLTLGEEVSDGDSELRVVDVDEIFEGLRDALGPAAELWGVSVRISTTVQEPRQGRPARIRHALLNLASLLQRTGEDPVELRAEALDDTVVRFSVSTPGRGPDPASVRAVGAVAAGTERRSRACFSHLGTEVAFRLVGSMGSTLEMESVAGGEMRFWFDVDLPGAAAADRS